MSDNVELVGHNPLHSRGMNAASAVHAGGDRAVACVRRPDEGVVIATLHVVRVFTGPDGAGGNQLGVFLDGTQVPAAARQPMAALLGFSETVFVDDVATGRLQIFTPAAELPFAGHPLVGTSWLLREHRRAVDTLRPPAGDVATWSDADQRVWIRGRAEWAPAMTLRRHASPAEVDALDAAAEELDFVDAWAWDDEDAGVVRCRVFASRYGIAEDEATGAAAVRLVTMLRRPITIHQGAASMILARPGPDGTAEVGGSVSLETVRDQALPN